MASLTLKKNVPLTLAKREDSHYDNYLRYVAAKRAENAKIFTASQQHMIPAYSPWAHYPKTGE